jgi:hypothetical protein
MKWTLARYQHYSQWATAENAGGVINVTGTMVSKTPGVGTWIFARARVLATLAVRAA